MIQIPLAPALKQFWAGRDPREQTLLAICGVIVAAALLYLLAWQPVANAQTRLKNQLPRLQQDLIELQRGIGAVKSQPGNAAPADGDLRSAVQAQLDRYGIKADLQALPQERIKIDVARQKHEDALKLIAALERSAGLHVEQAQLGGTNGMVQLSLTVGR
ncbi:type II secretion system protein GspM [Andreprevotia chitinilytica]|uniref:type II secretion system protein GspM n=1 Tax=Andreprevotia chitinilytica TaxID=396808 RepID=UPI000555EAB2|nr:type II secretion system protein GspM [Andreprevotia chitinilytica]